MSQPLGAATRPLHFVSKTPGALIPGTLKNVKDANVKGTPFEDSAYGRRILIPEHRPRPGNLGPSDGDPAGFLNEMRGTTFTERAAVMTSKRWLTATSVATHHGHGGRLKTFSTKLGLRPQPQTQTLWFSIQTVLITPTEFRATPCDMKHEAEARSAGDKPAKAGPACSGKEANEDACSSR